MEERFSVLETEFHQAYWDSQIDATPETEGRRTEFELELRRLKGDPDVFRDVQAALDQQLHDPVMRRQLEVLRLSLLEDQMTEERRTEIVELSSAVESEFASFRPSSTAAPSVTTTSTTSWTPRRMSTSDRRRGGFQGDRRGGCRCVREPARARNQAARDAGFADYYRMSLELQEMSEEWLYDILGEIESLTEEPYTSWKSELDESLKARFDTADIYPWHYSDPFFQALPRDAKVSLDEELKHADARELARATFAGWGIDLSRVLEHSDLYPCDRKCQAAFCIDVDRMNSDVRILANVVAGERWVEVMLHESGHAAYDVMISHQLPYLLRSAAHTFVTEAIALLSGRLLRDPSWLVDLAGIDRARVEEIAPRLRGLERGAEFDVCALGSGYGPLRAFPVLGPRRRPRRTVVGARREVSARLTASRALGPRLGGQDPHRCSSCLLPQLSAGRGPGVATNGGHHGAVGWPHRGTGGRSDAYRARLSPRLVAPVGFVDRRGTRHPAVGARLCCRVDRSMSARRGSEVGLLLEPGVDRGCAGRDEHDALGALETE